MRQAVLSDAMIQMLAKSKKIQALLGPCRSTLVAATKETGCGGCSSGFRNVEVSHAGMERFKQCLADQPPDSLIALKNALQVDTVSIYIRRNGVLTVKHI